MVAKRIWLTVEGYRMIYDLDMDAPQITCADKTPIAHNIGFYRHYHTALRLAEMILKRRSQQISGVAANQLPPFYIYVFAFRNMGL